MSDWQVKFHINAMVGINVVAGNIEEARKQAEQKLRKSIFKSEIEYLDGSEEFAGADNNDLWRKLKD